VWSFTTRAQSFMNLSVVFFWLPQPNYTLERKTPFILAVRCIRVTLKAGVPTLGPLAKHWWIKWIKTRASATWYFYSSPYNHGTRLISSWLDLAANSCASLWDGQDEAIETLHATFVRPGLFKAPLTLILSLSELSNWVSAAKKGKEVTTTKTTCTVRSAWFQTIHKLSSAFQSSRQTCEIRPFPLWMSKFQV